MPKKLIYLINILLLACCSSCANFIESPSKDVDFTLGEETASRIVRAVSQSIAISEQSEFSISFNFKGIKNPSQNFTVTKNKLAKSSFKLVNIPLNVKFSLILLVSFNGNVIYKGESNSIILDRNEFGKKIQIMINEEKASLNYDLGGVKIEAPLIALDKEYFIDDHITLKNPTPVDKKFNFIGWYSDPGLKNKVTKLGAENYLGDVILYAAWAQIWSEHGDKFIKIRWDIPVDYKKIQIVFNGTTYDIISPTNFKEFNFPTNGQKHSFEIKIVYNDDSISENVSLSDYPMIPLNVKPKKLTGYTSGSAPTFATSNYGDWEYVEFGYWPQSRKLVEENIMLSSETININGTDGVNGWTCYYGSDGYYYVQEGSEYYKLEPIKWRVLSKTYKYDGTHNGQLLLAENILVNQRYHTNDSKYDTSLIRSYLNNDFYINAFSKDAKENILTTSVDNSGGSARIDGEHGHYTNPCDNTNDKIFLLSQKEIVNSEYGFKNGYDYDTAKKRYATAYAKLNSGNDDQWWLRSPGIYTYESSRTVNNGYSWVKEGGYISDHKFDCTVGNYAGVVPALCIAN